MKAWWRHKRHRESAGSGDPSAQGRMGEVLRKVVDAEAQAQSIVEAAESQAKDLLADAQRRSRSLVAQASANARLEADQLFASIVQDAEREKQEQLAVSAQVEAQTVWRQADLFQAVQAVVQCVCGLNG